jgi:hypothetical protein
MTDILRGHWRLEVKELIHQRIWDNRRITIDETSLEMGIDIGN